MYSQEHGRGRCACIVRGCAAFLVCGFFSSLGTTPTYAKEVVPCFSVVTIEPGQSVKDLAKTYHTTMEQIRKDNPLLEDVEEGITLTIRENTHRENPQENNTMFALSRGSNSSWLWPAIGPISSDYGLRGYNEFHHGIDLAIDSGTSIKASKSGKVVKAERQKIYGLVLLVDHGNGVETLYAHNQKLLVDVGDYVRAGQEISLSGNTGRSTGPHLHFEIRYNGKTVDPKTHLPQQYMAAD